MEFLADLEYNFPTKAIHCPGLTCMRTLGSVHSGCNISPWFCRWNFWTENRSLSKLASMNGGFPCLLHLVYPVRYGHAVEKTVLSTRITFAALCSLID